MIEDDDEDSGIKPADLHRIALILLGVVTCLFFFLKILIG